MIKVVKKRCDEVVVVVVFQQQQQQQRFDRMELSLRSSQYKGSEGMTCPLSSYIWYMTGRRIKRQDILKEGLKLVPLSPRIYHWTTFSNSGGLDEREREKRLDSTILRNQDMIRVGFRRRRRRRCLDFGVVVRCGCWAFVAPWSLWSNHVLFVRRGHHRQQQQHNNNNNYRS